MDIRSLSETLKAGLATVQALAPLAALGGPGAVGVASIVSGLAKVGEQIMEKIEDGTVVATSDDKAEVQGLLAQIQSENDQLARRVDAT